MSTWNFMNAQGVYIYPSVNASDKGNVNSEFNVSGISEHLIQKSFVIKDSTEAPLDLSRNNNKISVTDGDVIIGGYYLKLRGTEGVLVNEVDFNDYLTATDKSNFVDAFTAVVGENANKPYHIVNNHIILKNQYKNQNNIPELPKIHFIIKLLKNTTGNVRGDLYEIDAQGNRLLTCRGCAWSFVTDTSNIDAPYIDVAQIVVNDNFDILKIENPDSKFSYINIDSVYNAENKETLSEFIDTSINDKLDETNKITYYVDETIDEVTYKAKRLELAIGSNGVEVTRYEDKSPIEYDENGNIATEPITEEDDTYSIDAIQARTHVAEEDGITESGTIGNKTNTNNGSATELSRADHDHDNRYIMNKSAYDGATNQIVGTPLQVYDKSLEVTSGSTKVFEVTPSTDNSSPHCTVDITGNVDVNGTITANQVFNAVWNDYGELYKKNNVNEHYEEGTVICKILGKDTYSISTYSNRKLVVGVVTNSYGHLLGGEKELSLEDNLKKYIPIALSGRIPVKVEQGVFINEGDILVVSEHKGRATTAPYPELGTIIGKALETTDGTKDKILMQVMLG